MHKDVREVGEKIRQIRKKKAIKQCDLATDTNISVAKLRRSENGESCLTIEEVFLIADTLDVNIIDLLPDRFARGCEDKILAELSDDQKKIVWSVASEFRKMKTAQK